MTNTTAETTLDVRPIPARQKHPTIFGAWTDLRSGASLLLINDHDPLPLYYQLACEHTGQFRWEYLERGPETWRVRLTRGAFADPGFTPPRKSAPLGTQTPAADGATLAPCVVDTRPVFARGETPCQMIDDAAASVAPGQSLVLLVPFEPVPLYAKLEREGLKRVSAQQTDGAWRVEFRRG